MTNIRLYSMKGKVVMAEVPRATGIQRLILPNCRSNHRRNKARLSNIVDIWLVYLRELFVYLNGRTKAFTPIANLFSGMNRKSIAAKNYPAIEEVSILALGLPKWTYIIGGKIAYSEEKR